MDLDKESPVGCGFKECGMMQKETGNCLLDIGVKPTVDLPEGERRITAETHIFDFSSYIYDETAKASFLYFLRDEEKFLDLLTIQGQITRYEKNARAWIDHNC